MVGLEDFELTGIKSYTRFWGLLMFGSYSVINVIVLLNLLIAMMSNSYAMIDVSSKLCPSPLFPLKNTNTLRMLRAKQKSLCNATDEQQVKAISKDISAIDFEIWARVFQGDSWHLTLL